MILASVRGAIIASCLLLGFQSCISSIGWKWQRIQCPSRTVFSEDLSIESAGGGFVVKYVYDDDAIANFPKSAPPIPANFSHWYMNGPSDPLGYADEDFFVQRALGFNYYLHPQTQYLRGARLFWISYWHLAVFFSIVALYQVLRARIHRGEPLPWQFRQRRRWLNIKIGLCPSCGYDLRTTPHRCPECGASPKAAIS